VGLLCAGPWAWAQGEAAPPAEPAPATAPAPSPPAAPDNTLKTADGAYELKIKTLEERVNELKERIFRSKQRLTQLQEAVVGGAASSAKARIVHRNEMGPTFKLREVHYFLDGAPLRQEVDDTGDVLSKKQELELFDGAILPGNHQLTVNMVFQGDGFSVFKYVEGYQFKIRSSHTFTVEEGREIMMKVVAYEQGNVTTEMRDRPTIRYDIEIRGIQKVKAPPGGASGEGSGVEPAGTGGNR
jgi:hypothetical protein